MVAPQNGVKRIRGVAVSRPIIIGTTATPLSPAERLVSPPEHTHRWTVAVRSAASNPMHAAPPPVLIEPPSSTGGSGVGGRLRHHPSLSGSGPVAGPGTTTSATAAVTATVPTPTPAAHVGVSTRGRESDLDFHKMVGGKDDLSYFIRRVQFKLHETYAQPTRNVDKSPFQITETGWGEFEIQVKIFFQPEASEKPITLYHHLKLHPWTQNQEVSLDKPMPTEPIGVLRPPVPPQATLAEHQGPSLILPDPTLVPSPTVIVPVVHSWQYEELVFPEPTEPFYHILVAHPPTPLPATSAEAFAQPSVYIAYEEQKRRYVTWAGTHQDQVTKSDASHAPRVVPVVSGTSATIDSSVFPIPSQPIPASASAGFDPVVQSEQATQSNGAVHIKREPGPDDSTEEAMAGIETTDALPNAEQTSTTTAIDQACSDPLSSVPESEPREIPGQGDEVRRETFTDSEADAPALPHHPHPLHSVSGQLIEALSQESVLGEGRRLDQARIAIVKEIEQGRQVLIEREKEIRRLKVQLAHQQQAQTS